MDNTGAARVRTSLYVGDIPKDLENPEDTLFTVFGKIGMVISIKVCRDINTQQSLGYAYVNYQSPADAERALEALNYTVVNDKELRVMWADRDPSSRKHNSCNLFVKNLDPNMNNRQLFELASNYGHVISCKQAEDKNGVRRGYGFIYYDSQESADKATAALNGMAINGHELKVAHFINRMEREKQAEKTFTTVYAKNFKASITEEEIQRIFGQVGEVASVFVSGNSKFPTKFAIITMGDHESAVKAIETLNNTTDGADKDTKLYVARLRRKADITPNPSLFQNDGRNVYVKHLPDTTTEEKMREIFGGFGNIESISLQRDDQGNFRGFGFVCYETKEAAAAAVAQVHMKQFMHSRPLYAQLAQTKDSRHRILETQRRQYDQQARMQQQYMGMNNMGNMGMGVFPGWAYPQARPMFQPIPHQMQYNMRRPQQNMRNNAAMRPQQKPQHRAMYAHPNQMPPQQRNELSHLANMSPEDRKNVLGERLYTQIHQIDSELAAKITGMLLEMETNEILTVLEDSQMLHSKVQEAIQVLKAHNSMQ